MIGVMPMSGSCASLHALPGDKSSNASRASAERSFCCARGIPRSARTVSASAIFLFFLLTGIPALDVTINFFLAQGLLRTRPLTELNQSLPWRITHRTQVGGVHLRVPAEIAEVPVHDGGVEEQPQPMGEIGRQALLVMVKDIQMILEPVVFVLKLPRFDDIGHDTAGSFLSGETLGENVATTWHEPFACVVVEAKRIGFFLLTGPGKSAAAKVMGVKQRDVLVLGLGKPMIPQAEIHNRAGGNLDTQ